jgi:two-component system LytT family response regulator
MTIRALILDDEPLSRQRLRDLLGDHSDIAIAGEAGDIRTASALAEREKPDVLFLDVVMPRGSGIDLLRKLRPRPEIIFTTAYSQYAVTAFDENALDYLVKPVSSERLEMAIRRLRRTLLPRDRPGVGSMQRHWPARIAVRHRSEVIFINVNDITWIAAEGNYCRVHTNTESYLVRGLINNIAARFDAERFVRIHRSSIVNAGSIRKVVAVGNGHAVILENGTAVRVGCSYADVLAQLIDPTL